MTALRALSMQGSKYAPLRATTATGGRDTMRPRMTEPDNPSNAGPSNAGPSNAGPSNAEAMAARAGAPELSPPERSVPELSVPELSVVVPVDPTKHGGRLRSPGRSSASTWRTEHRPCVSGAPRIGTGQSRARTRGPALAPATRCASSARRGSVRAERGNPLAYRDQSVFHMTMTMRPGTAPGRIMSRPLTLWREGAGKSQDSHRFYCYC